MKLCNNACKWHYNEQLLQNYWTIVILSRKIRNKGIYKKDGEKKIVQKSRNFLIFLSTIKNNN